MKAECKKLILSREALILCLIAFLLLFVIVMQEENDSPKLKKVYRTLISEYNLPYSEATVDLRNELNAFADTPLDKESDEYYRYIAISNLIYCADSFSTHNDMMVEMLGDFQIKIQNAPTEYIHEDLEKAYHAYNRAYEYHVCNTTDLQFGMWNLENTAFIYLYLLFTVIFFCNLFTVETESGMYQLLFASKNGKSGLFIRKISAALSCLVVFSFLFTIIPLLGIWIRRGLSFALLDEPLQCMEYFSFCPFSLTVIQYLLLSCAMHIIVGLYILGIISICSVFLKKGVHVFGFAAVFVFGSTAITALDKFAPKVAYTARKFGGCGLLKLQEYLIEYNTVNVAGKPIASLYLATAFTLAVSVSLLVLAYILYTHQPGTGGRRCH